LLQVLNQKIGLFNTQAFGNTSNVLATKVQLLDITLIGCGYGGRHGGEQARHLLPPEPGFFKKIRIGKEMEIYQILKLVLNVAPYMYQYRFKTHRNSLKTFINGVDMSL
jgi:hypothetical protein